MYHLLGVLALKLRCLRLLKEASSTMSVVLVVAWKHNRLLSCTFYLLLVAYKLELITSHTTVPTQSTNCVDNEAVLSIASNTTTAVTKATRVDLRLRLRGAIGVNRMVDTTAKRAGGETCHINGRRQHYEVCSSMFKH